MSNKTCATNKQTNKQYNACIVEFQTVCLRHDFACTAIFSYERENERTRERQWGATESIRVFLCFILFLLNFVFILSHCVRFCCLFICTASTTAESSDCVFFNCVSYNAFVNPVRWTYEKHASKNEHKKCMKKWIFLSYPISIESAVDARIVD